ncbi:hypothetical protein LK09_18145 [Microbacterium mangrovi]|uniref:Uncharacterized protein n=1 Tax=Microbacterium mangrovi TaxID=1348253 RepID=A0A0B1ZX44_9MICO|nr:hypothetical protein [Microbacterium mangrovi]KHK95750.1 hypothetical protein LK09_18145 [Microbacterium mangrovi]
MTAVIDTRLDGSPGAIEQIGHFLGNTVAAHAQSWSDDIAAGRRRVLDGWHGEAADAFDATTLTARKAVDSYESQVAELAKRVATLGAVLAEVKNTMSEARRRASVAGLQVSGTRIQAQDAPGDQNTVWQELVAIVSSAHQRWREAVRTFASAWDSAAGDLVSVATGLVTGAASAGDMANTVYRLRSVVAREKDRLATAQRNLADSIKDGHISRPKDEIYGFVDEAAEASRGIKSAQDAMGKASTKFRPGLRVGAKLNRGLWVLGAAAAAYGVYDDLQHGESAEQAVVSNGGSFAASLGAGIVTGAVFGTIFEPPVGTIVGAALGAIVGAGVGIFTSGVIDHLYEDAAPGWADTLRAGVDEWVETGEAIGGLATGAWHAIFG